MNDGRKKVAKNSVIYSVISFLTKALGMIMLPLYTNIKYISGTEYGHYGVLSQFIFLAVFFISLSLNNAAIRFYSDFKDDVEKVKRFFGTIMTFVVLLGGIVVVVFTLFRVPLCGLLFDGIPFLPNVAMTLAALVFYAIYTMYQGFLQSMQEGTRFARNGMGFALLHVFLNIVFLVFCKDVRIGNFSLGGLNGMMISLVASYATFSIIGVFELIKRNEMKICIDREMLKISLRYSIPLVPHSMANNMASYIPKLFLNKVDFASGNLTIFTAIHSVAMQFSSAIDVCQSAINNAQRPWFNEKMKHGDEGKREIIDFTMIAMRLIVIVCLGVGLFSQELVLVVARSPAYYEAWKIIPFFAMTHAVKAVYYNHSLAIMYDVRTNKKMFICSGSGTLFNFVVTGILVWWVFDLGIWGSAISFLLSRILTAALSIIICRRHKLLMYPLREMIMCVLVCGVACAAGILPINWYVIATTGEQIALFSTMFFVNFAYKLVIFAVGTFLIVGDQRAEFVDFIKDLVTKKKKKAVAASDDSGSEDHEQ